MVRHLLIEPGPKQEQFIGGQGRQAPYATKRTGLALLDTGWVLRTGSYLGPCQGLPDGWSSTGCKVVPPSSGSDYPSPIV